MQQRYSHCVVFSNGNQVIRHRSTKTDQEGVADASIRHDALNETLFILNCKSLHVSCSIYPASLVITRPAHMLTGLIGF